MVLARTDSEVPKRQGITYFLLQLHQPGVDIRALKQMTGDVGEFNEVFLESARVPDSHRVGVIGEGWKVANATLSGERQMVSGSGSGGVDRIGGSGIERIIRGCKENGSWDDPSLRQRLVASLQRRPHPPVDQRSGARFTCVPAVHPARRVRLARCTRAV